MFYQEYLLPTHHNLVTQYDLAKMIYDQFDFKREEICLIIISDDIFMLKFAVDIYKLCSLFICQVFISLVTTA